jgi:HCOMODA/2-hydroxy-3-carboxy-muconic semialdehyde decarboxylase
MSAPFEISDHAGHASDLLIRNADLGRALAEHLGEASVVLMRGHGLTAVGAGVRHAVYRAYYTGVNCEIQMQATRLGEPRFLSAEEARAADALHSTQLQIDRVWDLWARRFCVG